MTKLEEKLIELGYRQIGIWDFEKKVPIGIRIHITLPSSYINPNPIENAYITYLVQTSNKNDKEIIWAVIETALEIMEKDLEELKKYENN